MKLLDNIAEKMGANAYAVGRFDIAEKWFRRLEKTEPDSIRVLRNLGMIRLAKGDHEGANNYLLREEKLYGETYARHRVFADMAYVSGTKEEALKRYQSSLECMKDEGIDNEYDRFFLKSRISICKDAAKYEASREGCTRFHEGLAANSRGETDTALEHFLAATEKDPTNWQGLNNAGVIYLNKGDCPEKALELFEKAAQFARIPAIQRNIAVAKEAIKKAAGNTAAK